MEYTIKNYAVKSFKDILDDRIYSDELKLKYCTQISDDVRDKLAMKKKSHTIFVIVALFSNKGFCSANFRSNFSFKFDYNVIVPYFNENWGAVSSIFMYDLDARFEPQKEVFRPYKVPIEGLMDLVLHKHLDGKKAKSEMIINKAVENILDDMYIQMKKILINFNYGIFAYVTKKGNGCVSSRSWHLCSADGSCFQTYSNSEFFSVVHVVGFAK